MTKTTTKKPTRKRVVKKDIKQETPTPLPPATVEKPPQVGQVLHKCARKGCREVVSPHWQYGERGQFCSFTCEIFDKRERQKGQEWKYKPEYAKSKLLAYLRQCEKGHRPHYAPAGEGGDVMLVPINRKHVPSMSGYATYLGLTKVTLKTWAVQFEEFRKAMLLLKQIQEMYLVDNGLAGVYKEKITALMLMNFHGMKDKSEKTINNLFGIVKEVYEQADAMETAARLEDPFANETESDDNDSL